MEPQSGRVEPNETVELTVSVRLKETGLNTDEILISVVNNRVIQLAVSAIGTGSTITFDPPIFPQYDMGVLFWYKIKTETFYFSVIFTFIYLFLFYFLLVEKTILYPLL